MADDREWDDAASDVSDMDPESSVLAPVQARIEGQLRKQLETLMLNVHEATNEAKMMKGKREDCGVELYNVQQHLAKLQEGLEKGQENLAAIQRLREDKEREKSTLAAESEGIEKAITELKKKQTKYQTELDTLLETARKVEEFNEQIQNEIEGERRAAYKAEDDIAKMEKEKAKQDWVVDSLNERVRALTEQQAKVAAQLASQVEETKLAKDTLAEALAEMDAIAVQKKQHMAQWKSSIVGMQRRDEALRAVEDALNQQKEQLLTLDNEIVGYRHGIKEAQERNAKLSHLLTKTEGEVSQLEAMIDQTLERKAKATEKYSLLKKSLEKTDDENRALETEVKVLESETTGLQAKAEKAAKEVLGMEQRVMDTLNKQTTLKKGSQSALRDIEKMKNVIRDKEMLVTQMENELARIRVDTLQTESHNEVLKQTVSELEKELGSRDTLVEKMQVDIRRRHDEIERKQKALDQLNRQFEAIIAAQGSEEGEHVGPLEATINNLSKSITQKSTENDTLQRDWIRLQTELVHTRNAAQQLQEGIRELRAQATILTQKKNRMMRATGEQQSEIAELKRDTQGMHLEMKKLNTILSKNTSAQEDAANSNFQLENDLVKRLEERKREAVKLESKVGDVRQAKSELLQNILDAERDVLFWEKKIQIARETQNALDPTIGKDEIHRMRREIYIMEQRLGNLQREQRRKVEEMQKLVEHRDVLRTKGQAVQSASRAGFTGITKATVAKDNARLAGELRTRKEDAAAKDRQIKECLANTQRAAEDVERTVQETAAIQEDVAATEAQIARRQAELARVKDETVRKQRSLQRLRDAEKGLYKLSVLPEDAEGERAALEGKRQAIAAAVEAVSSQYPQLSEELNDIVRAL